MAYPELMEDVRKIIAGEAPIRVPVFGLTEEFDAKWYNKGSYEEIITNAEKLAACWAAAVREFDYDWTWLQIDDCIEFEVLGVGCEGSGNILRATKEYLPATRDTLKNLNLPNPERDGRMPIKLEALRRLRAEFGDSACVCGSLAAPYSSVALLYGLEECMMLIFTDEKLLSDTCDFFVELQAAWGKAQYEAGAHALWLGDCNAMSNLLSLEQYNRFAFDSCKRLITRLKDMGAIVFLHNSEEKPAYIEREIDLGPDIIGVGPNIDIAEAKKITQGKVALNGNLDPVNIIQNGSAADVEREVARIMKMAKPGNWYVFNSGEMVPRDTPEENIRTMVTTARKHGTV